MIASSNVPTGACWSRGRISVASAIANATASPHYHQSYQVRSFAKHGPALEAAHGAYPQVRLFDEPQLNTQGHICFMLDFFQRLKREGRPPLVGNDDVCRYLGPLAGSW